MSMPNLKCELINHIQKIESDGIQSFVPRSHIMVIGVLHRLQDGISLAPTSWNYIRFESRFVGSGESTGNTFHKPQLETKGIV